MDLLIQQDIQNSWIFQDAEKFKWWVDLHLMADENGEIRMSLSDLAHRWKTDRSAVSRFLKKLSTATVGATFLQHQVQQIRICQTGSYKGACNTNCNTFATLVNKGFEVIEAHWLFGTPAEKIDVVIHPESIIHSMVEFEDGSIKAQMGEPDMRTPISIALMYPERAVRDVAPFDFVKNSSLSFHEVDHERFPALGIAYDCLRRGGSAAATMNGANEVAVAAFLADKCRYTDIVGAIEYALEKAQFVAHPSLSDYADIDAESRRLATEYLKL